MKNDVDIQVNGAQVVSRSPSSCCICLDVRVGTILIGLFYFVMHVGWLFAATSTLMTPHKDVINDWPYFAQMHHKAVKHTMDQNLLGITVASFGMVIIVALVCGAIMRRSSYILPFFCLQVFDTTVTVMIAATMVSYAGQVQIFIEAHPEIYTHSEFISNMNTHRFRMLLVSFWLVVLTIKYYFMTVVWSCYKHCKIMEEQGHLTQLNPAYMLSTVDVENLGNLPTYDDVVKISPPPEYTQ